MLDHCIISIPSKTALVSPLILLCGMAGGTKSDPWSLMSFEMACGLKKPGDHCSHIVLCV